MTRPRIQAARRTGPSTGPRNARTGGQRFRLRRIAALIAAALMLAVGLTTLSPGVAHADLCKDAPPPIGPKDGMVGMMTTRPNEIPEAAPDPFSDAPGGAHASIGDVYGYQWAWANYDLGCGNDFLRDPAAVTNTQTANLAIGVTGAMIAGLDSMERLAADSQIGWLQQVLVTVAGSLKVLLLGGDGRIGWLAVAIVALGGFVAWRARKADYAQTAQMLAILAVCVALSSFTLLAPIAASKAGDSLATGIADAAGAQFSGSLTDSVSRESAYRTWLTGYFGDADSALAQELGPRLMSATHYTWSDLQRIETDPNARASIDAAKATEFKAVAAQVEQRSPAAYEVFTGRGERSGPSLLAIVTTVCMGFFAGVAFLMILVGRLTMQGLVIAAPIASLLGMLPPGRGALAKMWDLFTAALIGVAKFVLAAGIMSLVLGGITASDMQGPVKLFWILLLTVIAIVLTRPARTFKTFVPGLDPNQNYLRSLAGKIVTGVAAAKGVTAALPDDATSKKDPNDTGATGHGAAGSRHRTSLAISAGPDQVESMPSLDAPKWVQVDPAAATPGSDMVAPSAATTHATTRYPSRGQGTRWAGVLEASSVPQLEPAVISARRASSTGGDYSGSAQQPETKPAAGQSRHTEPVSQPALGSVDAWIDDRPASTPTDPSATAETGASASPAPTSSVDQVEWVQPSGVWVASDPTLYRSGTAAAPMEYVRLPEPEVDAHGQEADIVGYHSGHAESNGDPTQTASHPPVAMKAGVTGATR